MTNEQNTFRKNPKTGNAFTRFFSGFGLRQGATLGLIVGAIVAFIGFFTNDIVLIVGVSIMTAAAVCGIVSGIFAVKKAEGDKRNPFFRGGLETLIMMGVFVVIGIIGIISYFV